LPESPGQNLASTALHMPKRNISSTAFPPSSEDKSGDCRQPLGCRVRYHAFEGVRVSMACVGGSRAPPRRVKRPGARLAGLHLRKLRGRVDVGAAHRVGTHLRNACICHAQQSARLCGFFQTVHSHRSHVFVSIRRQHHALLVVISVDPI